MAVLGFTSVILGSYCTGDGFSGLTCKNSFLAIVFVEEYLGAEFNTLSFSAAYPTGPGVFSFSSKGFLGDLENMLADEDRYLVPVKAGS